jgi:transposase-like protein
MNIKGDKVVKVTSKGTRYVVQPEHIKIQAVQELENGELSIGEVMRKYEINRSQTIRNWLAEYSSEGEKYKVRERVDLPIKKQVVRQLEMGVITKKEAAKQNGVGLSSIDYWVKKYSCGLNNEDLPQKMELNTTKDKELKKSLEASKLKIIALETMIDIAESSLKIEIRKKSGTKQ